MTSSLSSYFDCLIFQGYLDFYIKTKNVRRAPFYILSIGNAVLMIVVMILHDLCDSSRECRHTFTKVNRKYPILNVLNPNKLD